MARAIWPVFRCPLCGHWVRYQPLHYIKYLYCITLLRYIIDYNIVYYTIWPKIVLGGMKPPFETVRVSYRFHTLYINKAVSYRVSYPFEEIRFHTGFIPVSYRFRTGFIPGFIPRFHTPVSYRFHTLFHTGFIPYQFSGRFHTPKIKFCQMFSNSGVHPSRGTWALSSPSPFPSLSAPKAVLAPSIVLRVVQLILQKHDVAKPITTCFWLSLQFWLILSSVRWLENPQLMHSWWHRMPRLVSTTLGPRWAPTPWIIHGVSPQFCEDDYFYS